MRLRFMTRLLFLSLAPALLLLLALSLSLWGLWRADQALTHFSDADAAALAAERLYALGLQGGQATRNVLLDRTDTQGRKNLQVANEQFEKAYADLLRLTHGSAQASAVQGIGQQFAQLKRLRDDVITLAETDPEAATTMLVTQERAIWRTLRTTLLEQVQIANADAEATHGQLDTTIFYTRLESAVLGTLAMLIAGVLQWMMRGSLRSELGGSPSVVRSAMRRVAEGDLLTVP